MNGLKHSFAIYLLFSLLVNSSSPNSAVMAFLPCRTEQCGGWQEGHPWKGRTSPCWTLFLGSLGHTHCSTKSHRVLENRGAHLLHPQGPAAVGFLLPEHRPGWRQMLGQGFPAQNEAAIPAFTLLIRRVSTGRETCICAYVPLGTILSTAL